MISSGVVCQTMSHTGYSWCVSLLTLLAMGVQGQEVQEARTPHAVTPENAAKAGKGIYLETPGSSAREPPQGTTKDRQAQENTPVDDPRCENTKHRMERAERSLLFLTAARVVCQIGDREWYGLHVLTLAMLVSGVQAEEKDGPPCLREKRAASQENYHLEAYNCNELENTVAYHIPQQCPEMKERVSPLTLSGTK